MKNSNLSLIQCAVLVCALYLISFVVFYLAYSTEYTPVESLSGVRFVILLLLSPVIIKYIIQFSVLPFYSLIETWREKRSIRLSAQLISPSVSVLIPAWNEEVGIIKTIKSVLATTYKQFEVIVINDGSTDSTGQLVADFIQAHEKQNQSNIKIKFIQLENGGKAKALNQALLQASGEIVITVDADCVMDKDAITQMVRRFTDKKVAAVAGNVIVGNRKKPIELIQQLEYMYGFFFKRADSIFNSVYIIGGAAAAYQKEVLNEVGGFDEDIITEDIEMSMRILAHGYKTRYAADAVVFTEGPSDLKGLCNQRLRWKFGRLLTYMKHRTLFLSLKKEHNQYLTILLLPLALYAEVALFLEGVMITLFYAYTIYTNDYLPLVLVISFITLMITIQIALDSKSRFHSNLLLLAPVAWLIFYFIDMVEFQALYRSLKRLFKREQLQWQRWTRVGLLSRSVVPVESVTETE